MTGAFGLMEYAEVKEYAATYDRQALYNRTQDQAFGSALSAFSSGQKLDFKKASSDEIEGVKRDLRLAIGSLIIERVIGTALNKAYTRTLAADGR